MFNRFVYMVSSNPEMQVLGRLGGAREAADKPKPVEKEETGKPEGDQHGYESMFKTAPVVQYRPRILSKKVPEGVAPQRSNRAQTSKQVNPNAQPLLQKQQSV